MKTIKRVQRIERWEYESRNGNTWVHVIPV